MLFSTDSPAEQPPLSPFFTYVAQLDNSASLHELVYPGRLRVTQMISRPLQHLNNKPETTRMVVS